MIMKKLLSPLLLVAGLCVSASAQDNSATPLYPAPGNSSEPQQNSTAKQSDQMPVFRANVYARNTKGINYQPRGAATTVDVRGTDLMPEVGGHAKVDGKAGRLAISVELTHMGPVSKFGGQYLTYVLW